MQQAYAQANEVVMIATKQAQEILDNATNEANALRMNAMSYADDQLRAIEEVLSHSIETSQARYENLLSTLRSSLDVVVGNRSQLFPASAEEPEAPAAAQEEPQVTNIPSSEENTAEE
jgi:F0F1-type ATP synthase membrane subunit b/b'